MPALYPSVPFCLMLIGRLDYVCEVTCLGSLTDRRGEGEERRGLRGIQTLKTHKKTSSNETPAVVEAPGNTLAVNSRETNEKRKAGV